MARRPDPSATRSSAKKRSDDAVRRGRKGDVEQAARRSQGIVASRAEPSTLGAKRQSGGRR